MPDLNGTPVSIDDLKILALTNFGHFTSIRVDNGRAIGLNLHMARLARDCRTVFETDLDIDYVRHLMRRAASPENGSYVLRVTVFDPALEMGHPGIKAKPKILITSRATAGAPLPPLRVQSARYSRDLPQVKHVGLMGSLMHRRLAQLNGYDDALFVGSDGFVTEGVTWNIGFFDGSDVIWPQGEILPGVTMAILNDAYDACVSARVRLSEVHGMVAAFATNTSYGVRPIKAIDGHEFDSTHLILRELQGRYAAIEGDIL